jgi:hypothetical protein
MANSLKFGFDGNIWHINPRNYSEDEFYDALNKLPVIPDSAYVAVPGHKKGGPTAAAILNLLC